MYLTLVVVKGSPNWEEISKNTSDNKENMEEDLLATWKNHFTRRLFDIQLELDDGTFLIQALLIVQISRLDATI